MVFCITSPRAGKGKAEGFATFILGGWDGFRRRRGSSLAGLSNSGKPSKVKRVLTNLFHSLLSDSVMAHVPTLEFHIFLPVQNWAYEIH